MSAVDLYFYVSEIEAGVWRVRLSCAGHDDVESELALRLDPDSRLSKQIGKIDRNTYSSEELKEVGSELWAALITGDVGTRYDKIVGSLPEDVELVRLRLALPRDLEYLPWEAAHEERESATSVGLLVSNERVVVLRGAPFLLQDAASASRPRRHRATPGKLRILVAIPADTGLDVSYEWSFLSGLRSDHVEVERMPTPVTPAAMKKALRSKPWDVFHFIGHGRVDENQNALVVLTSEDDRKSDQELDAEQFASILAGTTVQLAVMNCCLGAVAGGTGCLSGLGSYLLKTGLGAVIAMRYEIANTDATRFARAFYTELLEGTPAGQIDRATVAARYQLYLNQRDSARSFITPVLYLAPGGQDLENVSRVVAPPPPPPPPPVTHYAVPNRLLDALINRECVLIVGPGLLREGSFRGEGVQQPPGVRELVTELGRGYPDPAELELVQVAPDWAAFQLLERVCQQYCDREDNLPADLAAAIRRIYLEFLPVEPLRTVAQWNVRGILCSHFDGLLARAIEGAGRRVRVIDRIDDETVPEDDVPLVVHLRGSIEDPNSLVLTEEDHENLRRRLTRITPSVTKLMNQGVGRSFLFLGVSPQDEAVRAVVRKLIPDRESRSRGPVYFVHESPTAADKAYWRRFSFLWIEESPMTVIRAIDGRLRHGGAA